VKSQKTFPNKTSGEDALPLRGQRAGQIAHRKHPMSGDEPERRFNPGRAGYHVARKPERGGGAFPRHDAGHTGAMLDHVRRLHAPGPAQRQEMAIGHGLT